ncbi:hypothetical protein [Microbacterium foliorum]|uniref:hypothetical protein n=1 Tax=Microbacterium foliorum TaxID=104336 RepID=UPI003735C17E
MSNSRISHGAGFWVVASAFLLVMAYATVPTPLYPLYQEVDGFPVSVITSHGTRCRDCSPRGW